MPNVFIEARLNGRQEGSAVEDLSSRITRIMSLRPSTRRRRPGRAAGRPRPAPQRQENLRPLARRVGMAGTRVRSIRSSSAT